MKGRKIILTAALGLGVTAALLGFRRLAAQPPAPGVDPTHADASPPVPTSPPRFAEQLDVSTFQKGNIHTHTSWSDGDRPPEEAYLWYRDHGYNFLAITDHNSLTDPAVFRLLERRGRFVMIPGEEVTMMGAGRQVHVNALCHQRAIGGRRFEAVGEALAWAVHEVTAQGGVALVNHPNFDWALTAADIPSARGASLLEIFSGHPFVHTDGDEAHQSHEAIWDSMLTAGERFAGAAVDDSHYFNPHAPGTVARPGRAWIEVFADAPERQAICAALGAGRLYSSSGVKLRRITVTEDTYAITVATPGAEVEFLGKGGAVLERVRPGGDSVATYRLRGGEVYVRARITAPDGQRAWTQAARLAEPSPAEPAVTGP